MRHVVFNIERGQTAHETIIPQHVRTSRTWTSSTRTGSMTARSAQATATWRMRSPIIGMNYAYGLEFIELVSPNDNKGFHGNALFSRWPIRWAKVVHMPEQYNWYYDRQKRIGARVAIVCSLDIGGREVGAVSVHLENPRGQRGREAQMAVVYDEIKSFAPDAGHDRRPDLNQCVTDGNDIPASPSCSTTRSALPSTWRRSKVHAFCRGRGEQLLLPRVQRHRRHAPKPMPGGRAAAQAGLADGARHGDASTTARSRLRRRDCTWAEPG